MTIGLIGPGRIGCTLSAVFARSKIRTILFGHQDELEALKKNKGIIPFSDGSRLSDEVLLTSDKSALKECSFVFLAVNGSCLQTAWEEWGEFISAPVVNITKTLSYDSKKRRLILPHNIVSREHFVHFGSAAFPSGLLDGRTIVMGTAYGLNDFENTSVAHLFPKSIRVYTSPDLAGGELAGALKNVLALTIGIADGLKLGVETHAALFSRGAREIRLFAQTHGAHSKTFQDGSTFLADLYVTCSSNYSHNRSAGIAFAKGMSVPEIEKKFGTVEGLTTLKELILVPDAFTKMPIAHAASRVIFHGHDADKVIEDLLSRSRKQE